MYIEDKHKKLIEIAKEYMQLTNDYEHDINHMLDVVDYTKELINLLTIPIDKEVCIIAAYWHDVGRTKLDLNHEKLSAEMLRNAMENLDYEINFIDKCCLAIENHKWDMLPKITEGLIIKDADKLAYLGKRRWNVCLDNKKRLDSIIELLPRIRQEILHFEESREIYDRDIINLVKLMHDFILNKK